MNEVAIAQTLARDLTLEEQKRLRELNPTIFRDQVLKVAEVWQEAEKISAAAKKKPWWAFWK